MTIKWQDPVVKPATIYSDRTVERGGCINVKAFGGVGDGDHDDTEAIQQAVKFMNEYGGFVFFPGGIWTCSRTLLLDRKRGISFKGVGASDRADNAATINSGGGLQYVSSVLAWTGAAGGTLMLMTGEGFEISHMGFWGKWPTDTGDQAAVGLWQDKDSGDSGLGAIGTGKLSLYDTGWANFDDGIRLGTAGDSNNCDQTMAYRTSFRNCTYGYRCLAGQNVEHIFQFTRAAANMTSIFRFESFNSSFGCGGRLMAYMTWLGNISPGQIKVLDIDEVGSNSNYYELNGIFLDSQSDFQPVLVSLTDSSLSAAPGTQINISGVHFSGGPSSGGSPLIKLAGGGAACRISGSRLPTTNLLEANATNRATARLYIRDCRLSDSGITGTDAVKLTGNSYIMAQDCYARSTASPSFNERWYSQGNMPGLTKSGTATISNGSSSVTVNHEMGWAPGSVIASAQDVDTNVYISNISSTSFDINRTGTSGSLTVNWTATMTE